MQFSPFLSSIFLFTFSWEAKIRRQISNFLIQPLLCKHSHGELHDSHLESNCPVPGGTWLGPRTVLKLVPASTKLLRQGAITHIYWALVSFSTSFWVVWQPGREKSFPRKNICTVDSLEALNLLPADPGTHTSFRKTKPYLPSTGRCFKGYYNSGKLDNSLGSLKDHYNHD